MCRHRGNKFPLNPLKNDENEHLLEDLILALALERRSKEDHRRQHLAPQRHNNNRQRQHGHHLQHRTAMTTFSVTTPTMPTPLPTTLARQATNHLTMDHQEEDHPEEDHRMNPTTTMNNQASPTTRQRQHLRDELCDTSSASYAHAIGLL